MWKWWLIAGFGLLLLGVGIWFVVKDKTNSSQTSVLNQDDSMADAASTESSQPVTWQYTGRDWEASDTPPACPSPMTLAAPVDVRQATSILYPGQTRGGDYKPHGGFRFTGSNAVDVRIPLDSHLVFGSRYIEQGETQYLFVFTTPCGFAYRFDHLLELSPEFQAFADLLPAAKIDDSRTTNFTPPITVQAGALVATQVGFAQTANASLDFGLYDLRQPNDVTAQGDTQFARYGVCWFDYLSAADEAYVRGLPAADNQAGKTSDYCR